MLFLSYSRNDLAVARAIKEALESLGIDVWIDIDGIATATNWSDTIKTALVSADHVAIVLSSASVASRGVWAEFILAERHSKPVYVLRIDDADVPSRIAGYPGTTRIDIRSDPVTIDALRVALQHVGNQKPRAWRPAPSALSIVSPIPSKVRSFVRDMDRRHWIGVPIAGLSLLSTWPVSRAIEGRFGWTCIALGAALFVAAILLWAYTRKGILRRQIGFVVAALGHGLPTPLLGGAMISCLFAVLDTPFDTPARLYAGKLDRTTAIVFFSYFGATLVLLFGMLLLYAAREDSLNAYIEAWLPTTAPSPRDDDARIRQAEAFLAQLSGGREVSRPTDRIAVVYDANDCRFADALAAGIDNADDVDVRVLLVSQLLDEPAERWSLLADVFVLVVSPPLMARLTRAISTLPTDVRIIPVLLQTTNVRMPLDHLQWIDARRDYSFVVDRILNCLRGRDALLDEQELPRNSGFFSSHAIPLSVKARFALAYLGVGWSGLMAIIFSASHGDTRLAGLSAAYAVVVASVFFCSYWLRRASVRVIRLTSCISPLVLFVASGDRYVEQAATVYSATISPVVAVVAASFGPVIAMLAFSDWSLFHLSTQDELALWNPSPSSDRVVVAAFLALSALFTWLALEVRLG